MPARISKKVLQKMTDELNIKEGRPRAAWTRKTNPDGDAVSFTSNEGHILLDHATVYGGYALREISGEHGGEGFYWPRWTRVSGREMYAFLAGKLGEDHPMS